MKRSLMFLLIIFVVSHANVLLSIGGGMALYRYNDQGILEFLFAQESGHTNPIRQGFEFFGGEIGDHDIDRLDVHSAQVNDPMNFLRGAVRETLEESVFGPVAHSNLGLSGLPYDFKSKKIHANYLKSAIQAVVDLVTKNGIVFLYKNQVNAKKTAGGDNQNVTFLWNVTDVCKPGLLEAIVKEREQLLKNGFGRHAIGAEPDAFAWVPATELIKVIDNPFGDRKVQASKVIDSVGRKLEFVKNDNTQITLSKSCVGMIRDRDRDVENNQPNELHVSDGLSSSMRAVLHDLLNRIPAKLPVASRSASVPAQQSRARSQSAQPRQTPQPAMVASDDDLLHELVNKLDLWEDDIKIAIFNKVAGMQEALSYLKSMPVHLNQFIQRNPKAQWLVRDKFNEVGRRQDRILQLEKIILVVRAVKNARV